MAISQFDSFIKTLKKVFMLDQAELDFGIYRIMNQKRKDIEKYLNENLKTQVTEVLSNNKSSQVAEFENELKEARKAAKLKSQKMFMVGVFSVFCTCALGFSGFLLGQAELTELTDKSCKASRELEQIQSLNTQLAVKLKSLSVANSFEKNDVPVEIVKVHKGDVAKRS